MWVFMRPIMIKKIIIFHGGLKGYKVCYINLYWKHLQKAKSK